MQKITSCQKYSKKSPHSCTRALSTMSSNQSDLMVVVSPTYATFLPVFLLVLRWLLLVHCNNNFQDALRIQPAVLRLSYNRINFCYPNNWMQLSCWRHVVHAIAFQVDRVKCPLRASWKRRVHTKHGGRVHEIECILKIFVFQASFLCIICEDLLWNCVRGMQSELLCFKMCNKCGRRKIVWRHTGKTALKCWLLKSFHNFLLENYIFSHFIITPVTIETQKCFFCFLTHRLIAVAIIHRK